MVSKKHTRVWNPPHMPNLTKKDTAFSMYSIYNRFPCFNLFFCPYAWCMWIPKNMENSKKKKENKKTKTTGPTSISKHWKVCARAHFVYFHLEKEWNFRKWLLLQLPLSSVRNSRCFSYEKTPFAGSLRVM